MSDVLHSRPFLCAKFGPNSCDVTRYELEGFLLPGDSVELVEGTLATETSNAIQKITFVPGTGSGIDKGEEIVVICGPNNVFTTMMFTTYDGGEFGTSCAGPGEQGTGPMTINSGLIRIVMEITQIPVNPPLSQPAE